MSEAEEAWCLWHLLQSVSDTLWRRYESAFMDFCGEESRGGSEFFGTDDKAEAPF
jgi:hypothetical protein